MYGTKTKNTTGLNIQDQAVVDHYTADLTGHPSNARKIRKANPDLKKYFDKADRQHKAEEVKAVLARQKGA